ncbi:MAG: DUF1992 domain-containing protein [Pseudomonadota bacterium]
MLNFEKRAEQLIQQSVERGELDQLAGQGKPLELDDDSMVPAELRMANRILKNAGCVPREVELRREIRCIERLLVNAVGAGRDSRAHRRLLHLLTQLDASRGHQSNLLESHRYRQSLHDKMR